ncbi:MAG: HD-GYP domain-containing protein [Phycisphaerae bacterium]
MSRQHGLLALGHPSMANELNYGARTLRALLKNLAILLTAQLVCVAVGSWMHHQFLTASTRHALHEQTWSELETHAEWLQATLARTTSTARGVRASDAKSAWSTITDQPLPGDGVLIVDEQWRVLTDSELGRDDRVEADVIGAPCGWMPLSDAPRTSDHGIRGHLQRPDGPHWAVALEIQDPPGHLVVHRPASELDATAAALFTSLPIISGVSTLWICMLLGMVDYLILARLEEQAGRERAERERNALAQSQSLIRTRDTVIFGLAKLADSRDPETGDHLERISVYSATLASALQHHPTFRKIVTPSFVKLIRISSALHDIGKVGIDDSILRKQTGLTPEERVRMQRHTEIGGQCLREMEQRLGSSNFLQMAREVAYAHHEAWDGSGYPYGLKGDEIPLAARIVAIVDVYDALASKRVYKEALPHEACKAYLCEQAGKKFDPALIQVWLTVESKFAETARRFTGAEPLHDQPEKIPVKPIQAEPLPADLAEVF